MQPSLLRQPVHLAGLSLLRLQPDDRLVRLTRDGHAPAFAALVDRYERELVRYATRLVGPGRAEDAVQQTFVNAHRVLSERTDEVIGDVRPWLYRIAHNAALNLLRGDADGFSLDDPAAAGGTVPAQDDVARAAESRARLAATFDVIAALPAPQRDALLLRELEGRSHEEIAAALGVTPGAARQHLMRARSAVRAAAAGVVPFPLLTRIAAWAAGATPTGERFAAAAGGAGLGAGAGLVKLSGGVLATTALIGGAAVGTGVAPSPIPRHHHHAAPASAAPAGAPDDTTGAPAIAQGTTVAASTAVPPAGAGVHGARTATAGGRRRAAAGGGSADGRRAGGGRSPSAPAHDDSSRSGDGRADPEAESDGRRPEGSGAGRGEADEDGSRRTPGRSSGTSGGPGGASSSDGSGSSGSSGGHRGSGGGSSGESDPEPETTFGAVTSAGGPGPSDGREPTATSGGSSGSGAAGSGGSGGSGTSGGAGTAGGSGSSGGSEISGGHGGDDGVSSAPD